MKNTKSKTVISSSFDSKLIFNKLASAIKRDLSLDDTVYHPGGRELTIFKNIQLDDLNKRFTYPDTAKTKMRKMGALAKFKAVNKHMKETNIRLKRVLPASNALRGKVVGNNDKMLLRAKALIWQILDEFDEDEWFDNCKHTSGSSVGVSYVDTLKDQKWQWPLSITHEAIPLFERYLKYDYEFCNYISTKYLLDERSYFDIRDGSEAFTVPKNIEIDRFAAKELTGNVFLQKGLEKLMVDRLLMEGLDLRKLPKRHMQLAYLSSLTRMFGTIDFSSASDTEAVYLIKWLFPPRWFSVLYSVKSRVLNVPFNKGEKIRMHMFSNMGNATTFPIETLVFYALACAALSLEKDKTRSVHICPEVRQQVSVFGDDCILPTTAVETFTSLATLVGLIVNEDKTHLDRDDPFRESCGADYYAGRNVRPFMTKGPRSESSENLEPWLYTCMNSIIKKYITCFGGLTYVYHSQVFQEFVRLFRRNNLKLKLVPTYFPDDAGLQYFPDVFRFLDHYRFRLSPVYVNIHGLASFSYIRFHKDTSENCRRRYDWTFDYFDYLRFNQVPIEDRRPIQIFSLGLNQAVDATPDYEYRRKGSFKKASDGIGFFPCHIYQHLPYNHPFHLG